MEKTLAFRHKLNLGKILSRYAIYIILVLLIVAMSFLSKGFFKWANIINIVRQNSFVGMVAVGMTFVAITGGIDLSVGAVMAFASMVTAKFCVANSSTQLPLAVSVTLGILVAAVVGAVNGVLITRGKIEPFIATLGTQTILRGAALLLHNGRPVIDLTDQFAELGQGNLAGIPIPVWVFFVIVVFATLLLRYYRFGRRVFAVGGNEAAAKASGVATGAIKVWVYTLCGVFSGISGIFLSARLQSASPISGVGYELDAIAAVVIGGTSLAGGVGSMTGTIVGIFILGIITNGLDLLNVSAYMQQIIKGLIILVAALMDMRTKSKK